MVKLDKGKFEFFTPGRKPDDRTFEGSIESHMLEAARHLDELTAYRGQLPGDEARLVFAPKVMIDLRAIPPSVLQVLAAVGKLQTMGQIMEVCPLPDLNICRVVLMLIQRKIILVSEESGRVTSTMPVPQRPPD